MDTSSPRPAKGRRTMRAAMYKNPEAGFSRKYPGISSYSNHSLHKVLWVVLCCLLSLSYACTGPASPSSIPTTTLPPLAVSQSTVLGLTKAEWEQRHTVVYNEGDTRYAYVDNSDSNLKYYVSFWAYGKAPDDAAIYTVGASLVPILNDVLHIATSDLSKGQLISNDLRRKAVMALLPADAQLVKTQPTVDEHILFVDTFHSTSLENRYGPISVIQPVIQSPWGTDPPGTIHVSYSASNPPGAGIRAGSNNVPQPTPTTYPTFTPSATVPPRGTPPTDIPTVPMPVPSMPWLVTTSPTSIAPTTAPIQSTPSASLKATSPPVPQSPTEPVQPKATPIAPVAGEH